MFAQNSVQVSHPAEPFGSSAAARTDARQLPGSTLYIVTVMVVGICFFVARELVGFARAGLGRQSR